MPKPTKGELRWAESGPVARVTIRGKQRKSFALSGCRTHAEAEERCALVADLAQRFRRAGVIETPEALETLKQAGTVATGLLPIVLELAGELIGGELVAKAKPPAPTFREVAKDWTSGKLHKRFPDHVKAKDSTLDASRLAKLGAIELGGVLLGDIPIDKFTLDHAQAAMERLPEEAKRPGTRRAYAQLINRVLALAVYPCRIIAANPLPRGFLPKTGKPPAYPYLYPDEDARLAAFERTPLARRLLFGFLAREGCRISEAAQLTFADVDLERGAIALDENKTDDPRAWALDAGVVRALRSWRHMRGAESSDRVFVDEYGRPLSSESLAPTLRADLEAAGITRQELLKAGKNRRPIRVHDLRGTFITHALANGRSETWVADRTGHTSSQMINRYRRAARSAQELGLGQLLPLDFALPELSPINAIVTGLRALCRRDSPVIAPQVVGHEGLEPSANGLRVRCSTN